MKKPTPKKPADIEEVVPPKVKKDFDFPETHEALIPEKIIAEDPAEVLEETAETDDLAEEVELDEEEIDPFKDKWEQ